ncbi:cobalt-precorrin-5B (C(1))-methyltransferase [Methanoplanus sp. FWC-SCC4]|uniref:Cobalt-precorrin-5B C(1)-methyltransferase n=1 Tax=Methanochimaera problematica TaxID=2609417 RepID=A0AA97FD35_9EURY|nr:cobalt-precorrin-5B (C(1))-methyltransferase [Methanoplanus sp. FWC-SCC4]WOF15833.1 cobalt-precorrin-5B (C(1))-methyltransferase [Methanoplanus sp. FWC-SCC4]
MKDPVTGYDYPPSWVNACKNEESLQLVSLGLAVLMSDGNILRRGFTTGTTAAAACKSAVLSLKEPVSSVKIKLPCDLAFDVKATGIDGLGRAWKYSGDYRNDITSNLLFEAKAEISKAGIEIIAGGGIGRFERDTPRYKKGNPAISKTSMSSIKNAVKEAAEEIGIEGVKVFLTVPLGESVGKKTLNPQVGVLGGISVLGSTGLVEPWDDHLTESAIERIKGSQRVVLTTGRVGLRYSRIMFPEHEVILVGKYLEKAIDVASGEIIVCGLPALILKFIKPDILEGKGFKTVEEMSMSSEWQNIVYDVLLDYKKEKSYVRVILVNRDGDIVGDSK